MMFGHQMDFNDGLPPYFGVPQGGVYKEQYRCYSVAMSQASNPKTLEEGGKIIMPPSALSELTKQHIQYPMLFKLSSQRTSKITHCGVLEFVAEEGKVYLPHWMMINIGLKEGDFVWVENVTLSLATFAKFQPQNVDFLDITDPKAVYPCSLFYSGVGGSCYSLI
jgi:ubiquitin fusion degradation protein 1